MIDTTGVNVCLAPSANKNGELDYHAYRAYLMWGTRSKLLPHMRHAIASPCLHHCNPVQVLSRNSSWVLYSRVSLHCSSAAQCNRRGPDHHKFAGGGAGCDAVLYDQKELGIWTILCFNHNTSEMVWPHNNTFVL